MDEKKDKGLQGNEKIEEAILALQQEPTEELLAHALTVVRRRMRVEIRMLPVSKREWKCTDVYLMRTVHIM